MKYLKIIAILSAVFWAIQLIHIYWMFSQPLPDDPHLQQWAEHYRITSSLELAATVAVGIVFSLLSWILRATWAAIIMTCLSALVLWRVYLSSFIDVFRPPLGDGTFERATQIWWKLYSPLLGWHCFRFAALAISIAIWIFVTIKLSREQKIRAENV